MWSSRRGCDPQRSRLSVPGRGSRWIANGATTATSDTVGYGVPDETRQFLRRGPPGSRTHDKAIFSAHCHDDLGRLGGRKQLASLDGGVRHIECTINGIGERAGNASRGIGDGDPGAAGSAALHDRPSRPSCCLKPANAVGGDGRTGAVEQGRSSAATPSRTKRGSTRTACWKDKRTYEIMRPQTSARPASSSCSAVTRAATPCSGDRAARGGADNRGDRPVYHA